MPVELTDLPRELMYMTFDHLDLVDIHAVRFTCRSFAKNARPRFGQLIPPRQTDLSPGSLEKLLDPVYIDLIQHLIVKATVYDLEPLQFCLENGRRSRERGGPRREDCSPEEMAQARADMKVLLERKKEQTETEAAGLDLSMLTSLFRQLVKLQTLKLESAVYQDPHHRLSVQAATRWTVMWQKGTQTLKTVMTALVQSRLIIRRVEIYGLPWGCSVPCNDLSTIVQHGIDPRGLAGVMSNVQSLSLTLSDRADPVDTLPLDQRTAIDEVIMSAPANLISLMPLLQELHLHFYHLLAGRGNFARAVKLIGKTKQLSCLRRCTLVGFSLPEELLVKLLQRCPALESLTLRRISLSRGSWRTFFDQILTILPALKRLSVRLISHNAMRVAFDHGDHLTLEDRFFARYGMDFDDEAIRNGIDFTPDLEMMRDTGSEYGLRLQYANEHGPVRDNPLEDPTL